MIPCMGGWCRHRESCALYHAKDRRKAEDRRLCAKGQERPEPIRKPEVIETSNHDEGEAVAK